MGIMGQRCPMVVLSSNILPELRLTVEEYLQADLPEGQRYELVEGIVEMSPTPDMAHADSVDALLEALYEYGRAHPGAFARVTTRASVAIEGKSTVREPDLAVYAEWSTRERGWAAWLKVVPILVAEVVSPGQAIRDYRDKRKDYWRAGIREYWIIDPDAKNVSVLTRGEKRWDRTVFALDQEVRSLVLPGFAVAVWRLVD
jgi:Uma2 family endonuclease